MLQDAAILAFFHQLDQVGSDPYNEFKLSITLPMMQLAEPGGQIRGSRFLGVLLEWWAGLPIFLEGLHPQSQKGASYGFLNMMFYL